VRAATNTSRVEDGYHEAAEWIRWVDSVGSEGWEDIADGRDLAVEPVDSVGFVIKETADRVVMAQGVTKDGSSFHRLAIPKCCILKRWAIGKRRPVRPAVVAPRTGGQGGAGAVVGVTGGEGHG
jgi:hypothetical protein